MSDIDVFTIDDDFDPLAEIEIEAPSAEEQYVADYLPPIPDADKSIVPEPVALTAAERIDKLLAGMPGQKFRVLAVVQAADADEPRLAAAIVADVDAAYPNTKSVYDTARLLRLLTEAGAVEREGAEEDAPIVEQDDEICLTEDNFVVGEDGEEYLVVTDAAPATYRATDAGRAAVAHYLDAGALEAIIGEEPRYAPLYARIMSMVSADGGATTPQLNGAIDSDPLCAEPRRFCGYFIDKLETSGLVEWRDAWVITDLASSTNSKPPPPKFPQNPQRSIP